VRVGSRPISDAGTARAREDDLVTGPLVSVLTPSLGQARWLGDNLDSVERQTYDRLEHVVIDGNSTDGSVELLVGRSRPGLSWLSEPDRGQSHALNKAFVRSTGEIIGWLNSDDAYFGPTVVEDVVRIFEADPDLAVVYGHALLVNAEGLVLQTIWVPPFDSTLLRLHDFIVQPTTQWITSCGSVCLWGSDFDVWIGSWPLTGTTGPVSHTQWRTSGGPITLASSVGTASLTAPLGPSHARPGRSCLD